MNSSFAGISQENFTLVTELEGNSVRIKLRGNCEMETTPALEAFLNELHIEASNTGGKHIAVDCQDLYFMNSASIKCLVSWVKKARAISGPNRYRVEFITNRNLSWQRRSLEAIQRFASDIVTIH